MPKTKSTDWKHIHVVFDDNDQNAGVTCMQCRYCDKSFAGGVSRIQAHLVGTSAMKKSRKIPKDVM